MAENSFHNFAQTARFPFVWRQYSTAIIK